MPEYCIWTEMLIPFHIKLERQPFFIFNFSVADPKQKFRIRILSEVSSDPNSGFGSKSETGPKILWPKICMQPINTKCTSYLEYHSFCTLVGIGIPPPPQTQPVCSPLLWFGGGLVSDPDPDSNPNTDSNPGFKSGSEYWIRIQIWNWSKLFLY